MDFGRPDPQGYSHDENGRSEALPSQTSSSANPSQVSDFGRLKPLYCYVDVVAVAFTVLLLLFSRFPMLVWILKSCLHHSSTSMLPWPTD